MRLIDRIDKRELKELLGKCWITHDGMWFYHCQAEHGMEITNRLNKAAIGSLASIEIQRFIKLLQVKDEDLKSFAGLKEFITQVIDFLIPDFMNVTLSFSDENVIGWSFNEKQCFAFNGVEMLGVADEYECGPLHRVKCWLQILGINYEMMPDVNKCVMPDKKECNGMFRISL